MARAFPLTAPTLSGSDARNAGVAEVRRYPNARDMKPDRLVSLCRSAAMTKHETASEQTPEPGGP
jgi:hypothetical protein